MFSNDELLLFVLSGALLFFAASLLFLFFRRGIAMQFSLLASFLCAAYSCFATCPLTYLFGVVLMYFGLWIFMLPWYIGLMAKDQTKKDWLVYSSEYESIPADPNEFTWLNLEYYDEMGRKLEELGFHKIHDSEMVNFTRVYKEMRNFNRLYRKNEDFSIMANISQTKFVRPKNRLEKMADCRVLELTTEFTDGTFLMTANTANVNAIVQIDGFTMQQFPSDTSPEFLLQEHEEAIERITNERNISTVTHTTDAQLYASAIREFRLFREDRMKKGGFSPDEVERMRQLNNDTNRAPTDPYWERYYIETQKRVVESLKKQKEY